MFCHMLTVSLFLQLIIEHLLAVLNFKRVRLICKQSAICLHTQILPLHTNTFDSMHALAQKAR